ncbi:MAG: ABC transporter ATP-binding protein [Nitrospirota bacterium]
MNVITVEDIRKVYRASGAEPIHALHGVSFEVSQGQVYGLLGPNGAGKTTLVKILTTLTAPTSGHATICGFDLVHQALDVRRQIVAVLQQTAVDGLLTVEDNLRIYAYLHGVGADETRARMRWLLEEFELGSQARQTVQHLSLGTKRRIQVAKIFMVDAPVIFLDESTTGMDPLMRRRVLDRIRLEAKKGRTVLLTTQVLSEAEELCDTIMIINRGKTLAAGTLQDLRRLSNRMFRVTMTFARDGDFQQLLQPLNPASLRIDGDTVDMLFKGEEAQLLGKLAEVARAIPILHFEVQGAGLEEIFVELVQTKHTGPQEDGAP